MFMTKDPLSPALNPQWKEMALPHYLKVLRVEIQKGWVADETITKGDRDKFSAARKRLEKKRPAKGSGRTLTWV